MVHMYFGFVSFGAGSLSIFYAAQCTAAGLHRMCGVFEGLGGVPVAYRWRTGGVPVAYRGVESDSVSCTVL